MFTTPSRFTSHGYGLGGAQVAVAVTLPLTVGVGLMTGVAVALGFVLAVAEGVLVSGGVVALAVAVEELVTPIVAVPVAVAVGEANGDDVALAVKDAVELLVGLNVGGFWVGVDELLEVGDDVAVEVEVKVVVAVDVLVEAAPTWIWAFVTVVGSDAPFCPAMTTVFNASVVDPFASAVRLKVSTAPEPVAPALVFPPRIASAPTATVPWTLSIVHG
jgi:hypothetical protein